MTKVIGIRFKSVGKIYYFDPDGHELAMGDGVIVETARGTEYGKVAMTEKEIDENCQKVCIALDRTFAFLNPPKREDFKITGSFIGYLLSVETGKPAHFSSV